jgi:serine/threonine protein kinase
MPDVGAEIGGFRLCEVIGRGSMASIFRAEHLVHGHTVAVKVLLPEYCTRPEAVRRFAREIQAVNRARHPNVLEITDLVYGEGQPPLLVMELLQGEDLAACTQRRGPLPPEQALEIMIQVCDALAAMHRRSVVHRDLKPGNIYLVGGGEDPFPVVKVLDFGLAKFLYEEDPFLHTRTGCAVGTPEYMPPEQIRGQKVDERIDLYAVGSILYEMIAGKPPFHGGSVFDLVQKVLKDDPPPPSSQLPPQQAARVPALLDQVVMRCLAKDPEHRIQEAEQLKALLQAAQRDPEDVVLPPLPRETPLWIWAAVGLSAATIALGTAAWLILS